MSVEESEYICDYCSRSFTRKYNLLTHIENCHIKESCYCNICEQRFGSPAGLQLHLSRGHNRYGEALPECDLCGRIFKRKQNIISHMLTIHLQLQRQIKCNICSKFFTTDRNLKRHINQIHNRLAYLTCNECNKIFKGKRSLILHIQTVHTKKISRCDTCGKIFMNARNLRRHLETHNREKAEHKCSYCSKVYSSSQSLKRHIRSMHYDTEKHDNYNISEPINSNDYFHKCHNEKTLQYFAELVKLNLICDLCNFSFTDEQTLRQHIKKNHGFQEFYKHCKKTLLIKLIESHVHDGNKQKDIYCEFCPQIFVILPDLKCHMKIHHNVEYNLSTCNVCFMKFLSRESLRFHKMICFQPPDVHSCDRCDKLFTKMSSLKFHMRIFHPETQSCDSNTSSNMDDETYKCDNSHSHVQKELSDKQLQTEIYKKIFLKNVHSETHIHNNMLMTCTFCNKRFKSKNLKQHIELCHPGEGDYKCNECKQLFKEKNSLQKHVKSKHTKDLSSKYQDTTVYKCVVCDVVFKGKQVYEEHKKNHVDHIKHTPCCVLCTKYFSSRKTLRRHIKNFHNEFQVDDLADYGTMKPEFIVQCEDCIKNFTDDYHFGIFQKWKDVPTSIIFKCESCKCSYNCLEYLIQRYKQKFSTTKGKLYLSELCTTEMSDTESQMGHGEVMDQNVLIQTESSQLRSDTNFNSKLSCISECEIKQEPLSP